MGVGEMVGAAIQAVRLWRDRRRGQRRDEQEGREVRRDQARRDLGPLLDLQEGLPRVRECAETGARDPSRDARNRHLRKCAEDARAMAARTRHRDVRQAVERVATHCEAWIPVESEEGVAAFLAECESFIGEAEGLIRARIQETHDIASGELD